MIRTIDEFIKAKKRLNTTSFSTLDIVNILNTEYGYIIINNVKIPIKNGSLDLTQWDKPLKAKKDNDKRKEQIRKNVKAYRDRKKALNGLIPTVISSNDYLTINGKNKTAFREIANKKPSNRVPKRLITAIRLINVSIPKKANKKPIIHTSNIITTNECDMVNTLTQNKLLRLKKCDTCNGFNVKCKYHIKTVYIDGINITNNDKAKMQLKGI